MQIQEFTAGRDWRSIHSSRYGPLLTFLQSRCWISKTKDGPISNMLLYRSFQIQKRKEIGKAIHLSSNTQEDIHLSQYLLDLPIVETHNPNVESALQQHFCYVIFSQKTGGVSFDTLWKNLISRPLEDIMTAICWESAISLVFFVQLRVMSLVCPAALRVLILGEEAHANRICRWWEFDGRRISWIVASLNSHFLHRFKIHQIKFSQLCLSED